MNPLRLLLLVGLVVVAAPSAAQHEDHAPKSAEPADPHAHHAPVAAPVIPRPSDADRAAAFPDLGGMTAEAHMAAGPRWRILADRVEWQDADEGDAFAWDLEGWFGGDFDRVWLRTEGQHEHGGTRGADLQLLYGHAFARWWEMVAGMRHDTGPGPSRDWMAVGVQGLAPYMLDVEVTAYMGGAGRTALRLEGVYELRLTSRLVLQPQLELDLYGKDDPETRVGSGLSQAEAGLRLRYEIRRELAPYLGIVWQRRFGDTADFARAAGDSDHDTRLVAGIRVWF
jgi:copper resistance protein B